VFVTPDVDEASLLSDRILFMYNKKIELEITAPFARPRKREEIFKTPEYIALRDTIMSLFFRDMKENIGGNEVII
jgi:ABC-type nitrate/sulfonate/bicarbonate transport system ATPase subunit